ncbi:hypothetical protein H0H93_009006 [Arthromyces matolae]|nr:hypothetical protein H0H93_009006 [Arthromyces matolae]
MFGVSSLPVEVILQILLQCSPYDLTQVQLLLINSTSLAMQWYPPTAKAPFPPLRFLCLEVVDVLAVICGRKTTLSTILTLESAFAVKSVFDAFTIGSVSSPPLHADCIYIKSSDKRDSEAFFTSESVPYWLFSLPRDLRICAPQVNLYSQSDVKAIKDLVSEI